jgi:hypothetical protein
VSFRFTQLRAHRAGAPRGVLELSGHSGKNSIWFDGVISPGRRLQLGRYLVTVVATDAAGLSSKPQRLRFTIAAK